MLELAITKGVDFLRYTRNATAIELPNGDVVMGPLNLSTLPHVAGDYTIRRVEMDGPQPGPLEIGGTEPPVVEGDVVIVRRTVQELPEEAVAAQLSRRKAEAKGMIDTAAEAARQNFITPGSGQAMVYQQKAAEARALQAGGGGPWPHLEAEVGVTLLPDGQPTTTTAEVASVVLAMEAAWLGVSANIEGIRLRAKRDVDEAADFDGVNTALSSIEWPAP